MVHN
jgi:hypothetical protein